jgi:hypothetical protein
MEKNEFDCRLGAVLRTAAKAGDRHALRAWRTLNGYAEEPHPSLPGLPVERSWFFERTDCCRGPDGEPVLNGGGFVRYAEPSGADERASNVWGAVEAMEIAFAAGLTTRGEAAGDAPFVDASPAESRARRAALTEAVAAATATRNRLLTFARAGGTRKELTGLRIEAGRREAVVKRASRP